MSPQNKDQFRLSVILYDFWGFLFSEKGKPVFLQIICVRKLQTIRSALKDRIIQRK